MKHKHAELFHILADGNVIEYYDSYMSEWYAIENLSDLTDYECRIRPIVKLESNPHTILKRWVSLCHNDCFVTFFNKNHNVKFEFDENNNLVKVEMI